VHGAIATPVFNNWECYRLLVAPLPALPSLRSNTFARPNPHPQLRAVKRPTQARDWKRPQVRALLLHARGPQDHLRSAKDIRFYAQAGLRTLHQPKRAARPRRGNVAMRSRHSMLANSNNSAWTRRRVERNG
jgi:hypothetical protein